LDTAKFNREVGRLPKSKFENSRFSLLDSDTEELLVSSSICSDTEKGQHSLKVSIPLQSKGKRHHISIDLSQSLVCSQSRSRQLAQVPLKVELPLVKLQAHSRLQPLLLPQHLPSSLKTTQAFGLPLRPPIANSEWLQQLANERNSQRSQEATFNSTELSYRVPKLLRETPVQGENRLGKPYVVETDLSMSPKDCHSATQQPDPENEWSHTATFKHPLAKVPSERSLRGQVTLLEKMQALEQQLEEVQREHQSFLKKHNLEQAYFLSLLETRHQLTPQLRQAFRFPSVPVLPSQLPQPRIFKLSLLGPPSKAVLESERPQVGDALQSEIASNEMSAPRTMKIQLPSFLPTKPRPSQFKTQALSTAKPPAEKSDEQSPPKPAKAKALAKATRQPQQKGIRTRQKAEQQDESWSSRKSEQKLFRIQQVKRIPRRHNIDLVGLKVTSLAPA
jgi:hypothetical protein